MHARRPLQTPTTTPSCTTPTPRRPQRRCSTLPPRARQVLGAAPCCPCRALAERCPCRALPPQSAAPCMATLAMPAALQPNNLPLHAELVAGYVAVDIWIVCSHFRHVPPGCVLSSLALELHSLITRPRIAFQHHLPWHLILSSLALDSHCCTMCRLSMLWANTWT